jgi:hypothetical protein
VTQVIKWDSKQKQKPLSPSDKWLLQQYSNTPLQQLKDVDKQIIWRIIKSLQGTAFVFK